MWFIRAEGKNPPGLSATLWVTLTRGRLPEKHLATLVLRPAEAFECDRHRGEVYGASDAPLRTKGLVLAAAVRLQLSVDNNRASGVRPLKPGTGSAKPKPTPTATKNGTPKLLRGSEAADQRADRHRPAHGRPDHALRLTPSVRHRLHQEGVHGRLGERPQRALDHPGRRSRPGCLVEEAIEEGQGATRSAIELNASQRRSHRSEPYPANGVAAASGSANRVKDRPMRKSLAPSCRR